MRRKIIESLTYPRMLMMSGMDVHGCPMNLYFNADAKACQSCGQDEECRWLNKNDEFSVLTAEPIEVLFDALLFSIDFVDAHVTRQSHNYLRCTCETCTWIKEARFLARQFKGKSVIK